VPDGGTQDLLDQPFQYPLARNFFGEFQRRREIELFGSRCLNCAGGSSDRVLLPGGQVALHRARPAPTVERVHVIRPRDLSYSKDASCCPQGCAFGARTARQVLLQAARPEPRRHALAIDSRVVAQPRPPSPVCDAHHVDFIMSGVPFAQSSPRALAVDTA
jgi:hypothetical protein